MTRFRRSRRDRLAASLRALASITCARAVAVPERPDATRPNTAEAAFDLRGALLQPALQVTLAPNPKPVASLVIVLPEDGAAKIDKVEPDAGGGFEAWIDPEIRRALMAAGIDAIAGDVPGQVEAVAGFKGLQAPQRNGEADRARSARQTREGRCDPPVRRARARSMWGSS